MPPTYETLLVERDGGIGWLTFNRPEKRNAMNPRLLEEFLAALTWLEFDAETRVLVLTGAGDAWSAGMDLKEFFRDLDDRPDERRRVDYVYHQGWQRLNLFPKPTLAMVNGYCFGGAFTRLIMCDLAIAAEGAIFGLSEINWGIVPGGVVTKAVADILPPRDALYYTLTGDTFDGRQAAAMRLVNFAVPAAELRAATLSVAQKLMSKNAAALRAAKETYKFARTMDYAQAQEYLQAKMIALQALDPEHGRAHGITGFVEDKTYRPGFESYTTVQPPA